LIRVSRRNPITATPKLKKGIARPGVGLQSLPREMHRIEPRLFAYHPVHISDVLRPSFCQSLQGFLAVFSFAVRSAVRGRGL
jgi:hypothetical protein